MKFSNLLLATILSATAFPPLVFAQNGSGPSFNCARARTMAEAAICESVPFAAQDRTIASLYARVRAATPSARRAALARDQARFNRSREYCYTPEQAQDDCLESLLQSRVFQLNGWLRSGYR